MTAPVHIRITRFEVSVLPADHSQGSGWSIQVEHRGRGDLWAARRGAQTLDRDGVWRWEPTASDLTNEFLERCRYPLATALALAAAAAPDLVHNGRDATSVAQAMRERP